MLFIPWRYIADWKCVACGLCCKTYSVVLSFPEWLSIVKNFGVDKTVSGLDKFFMRRGNDGSCVFLRQFSNNMCLCGIQQMKPKACKLWPFKISTKPKFGHGNEAVYSYAGNKLYIYADSTCRGLRYGRPSWEFTDYTLKELVEIALGLRNNQSITTASISFPQSCVSSRIFNARNLLVSHYGSI